MREFRFELSEEQVEEIVVRELKEAIYLVLDGFADKDLLPAFKETLRFYMDPSDYKRFIESIESITPIEENNEV